MIEPYYHDDIHGITIYRGDCRDILPQFPDKSFDLVLTDPPYGVGVSYGENYNDRRKDYWEWMRENVELMREWASTVVFTHRVTALAKLSGWDWIAVWNKPGSFGARLGNSPVLPHWEPIFLYGIHLLGTQTDTVFPDVLTVNPEPARAGNKGMGREKWTANGNSKHPCPKPKELMRKILRGLSCNETRILDPFMESGTTLVAAKQLGRKAVGIEIEEKYCGIAVKRLSQMELFLERSK